MYNMEKIPTAKEFYLKTIFPVSIENNRDDIELWFDTDDHSEEHLRIMIEFAKLHVEAALKEASSKVTCSEEYQYDEYDNAILIAKINRDSILNSYPLDNIK